MIILEEWGIVNWFPIVFNIQCITDLYITHKNKVQSLLFKTYYINIDRVKYSYTSINLYPNCNFIFNIIFVDTLNWILHWSHESNIKKWKSHIRIQLSHPQKSDQTLQIYFESLLGFSAPPQHIAHTLNLCIN